jgi:trehalose transport system substrate-binding protein
MRSRSKAVVAVLGAVAFVAVACGGGGGSSGGTTSPKGDLAGTTITFSVSLAESEQATVQDVLKMFQDQTGVIVKLTNITSADLPQKLKVEVDSNNHTVQLFAQDNLALQILVDQGLVEDLSDVQIPDGVQESLIPDKFDGKQYFLPFRPNVRVAYVNKERFDAAGVSPPQTVDDLVSVAQKLKDAAGGTPKVTLSLAQGDPAGVTVSEWIVSYGGNPLILNDQGSIDAFTQLQQLWQQGLLARESLQAKYDTEVDNLRGETAWLAQNWPFTTASLADQGVLEKFQVYEGWAGPSRAAHVIGGDVLGIPKGVTGKQKDAAIALAQFLVSKDAQEIFVAKNTWPSVRTDALGEVPSDQKETFDAITAALKDGWYRPNVIYWSDASDAMNEAIQRIMIQGEDVTSKLNELHDKIASAAQTKGAPYPPSS